MLDNLGACDLHKRTPYGMKGVSSTQLSIARHYGGIIFQGEGYTYNPIADELIRNDVLKWKMGLEKKEKKARKQELEQQQTLL